MVREPLLEPAVGLRLGQVRHQLHRAGEEHRVAGDDRLAADNPYYDKSDAGFRSRGRFVDWFFPMRRKWIFLAGSQRLRPEPSSSDSR